MNAFLKLIAVDARFIAWKVGYFRKITEFSIYNDKCDSSSKLSLLALAKSKLFLTYCPSHPIILYMGWDALVASIMAEKNNIP